MGNCIHTLLCKHGNKVTDVWSDDEASTEKIKESPQDAAEQKKTGTRRCIKITLTRKQLEQLLQQNPQGVSFQRKWKPSLQTIVEKILWLLICKVTALVMEFLDSTSLHFSPLSLTKFNHKEMEIQAKLMEYRFHFMVTIMVSVIVASLVYAAPRILNILAYFWPLFASTAAFLAMAITFGGFQQLSEEATGERLMDYVAGRPEDSHKNNLRDDIEATT
ncbi:transmembrane protein [Arabidopsis thaliana]|uniref:Transmembrane protein n=1 Tax=Arabidopsis thaliana TaxID=3702 RepID=F4JLT3_ARATH|nr:uncharacterized protein AT4G16400 [Arabidopsis thaliana]AEE83742.1 transmembrane protein [Arabidopsis thaliana]|eukprot:NP_193373.3 transmembrane protein [Arabidopsis thaliana]